MNDNFQSGKTQAIDLDELHVASQNRPAEREMRGEFELDKWGDDPWASTEESRRRRRWAEDDRWSGDDEEKKSRPEDAWDVDEESLKAGWHAPKRGDQLETDDGWDDWDNFGGAPKELDIEQESKDFGGYRRVQAAAQYAQADESNYADGHAQRDDLYRQKEAFGTSGVRERRGDPYANIGSNPSAPLPEMKPVGTDWDDAMAQSQAMPEAAPELKPTGTDWDDALPGTGVPPTQEEEDMRASAKISAQNAAGDDIPGVSRASIIIFQADTEPVVYELKKLVTTIGRGLDNMVILNDPYASRHHLSVQYSNGWFELYALSQDNLATVNGYPISHIVLMNNDQIEVGATRIRFILGPISSQQMQMSAPINGKPMHVDPPPRAARSPKTTRKNLILLVSSVSVIVVLLIVGLVIMAVKAKPDTAPKIAENAKGLEAAESAAPDADAAEEGDAGSAEQAPVYSLKPIEESVLDGMIEGFSGTVGAYKKSKSELYFEHEIAIKIDTTPAGARIYNGDGSLRGITPYEITERAAKKHSEKWTIRADGYKDKMLDVAFDEPIHETIALESATPAPKAKPKPKAKAKPASKPKAKQNSGGNKPGRRLLI